jgi:hypothetical protein
MLFKDVTAKEAAAARVAQNSPDAVHGLLGKHSKVAYRGLQDTGGERGFGKGLMGQEYTLRRSEYLSDDFKTRNAIARTVNYTNPFNSAGRQDLMNSMGFLTNNQKLYEKANRAYLPRAMISGFAGLSAYESMKEGENPILPLAGFAAEAALVMGGLRVGRGVGGVLGTAASRIPNYVNAAKSLVGRGATNPPKIGGGGKFLRLGMAGAGGLVGLGAAVGMVAVAGISDIVSQSTSSDGAINKMASEMYHPSQYGTKIQTNDSLTMRQKSLAKMSKAGLNDRALMLGNEALVLRGMM